MSRLLIAGIGNIFMGDDAFGVETVRQLAERKLPAEVVVIDFGIRAYDLAYALTDEYDAAILVDAVPRGQPPGTLFLIEPHVEKPITAGPLPDAHSLNPVAVFQMARLLGDCVRRLYLVGCEPHDLGAEEGRLGLSEPVRAAVPGAIKMIESLVDRLLLEETKTNVGFVPA